MRSFLLSHLPGSSCDVAAAFVSYWLHERGIHAVWSGAGVASVTGVRFRCHRH
jgi:hypothetical protein